MEELNNVDIDTSTDETIEEVDIFDEEDTVETLQEKLLKKDETNKQLFARLKKAEALAKEKPEVKEVKKESSDLSMKDAFALAKANINEEDIDEVTDYAKMKGISIADAIRSSVVKTILAEKEEERNTANATATGNVRKGVSKPSGSALLEKARKGELPESDEDMSALIKAQFERN